MSAGAVCIGGIEIRGRCTPSDRAHVLSSVEVKNSCKFAYVISIWR